MVETMLKMLAGSEPVKEEVAAGAAAAEAVAAVEEERWCLVEEASWRRWRCIPWAETTLLAVMAAKSREDLIWTMMDESEFD